jgi:hypothetical protein
MDAVALEPVARRFGLDLVLELGSMVTGHVHARRDLDLAILLDRSDLPFDALLNLQRELQRLHPRHEVDVAILNRADPLLLRRITERCRLIYGSRQRLAELQMYAFRRYQDHRRYLALEREYVERTLARLTAP